jgi:hypothetical protein
MMDENLLGKSRQDRLDILDRAEQAAAKGDLDKKVRTYTITNFKRKSHDLPILRVNISVPKYRLRNGRTLTYQLEYVAKHGLDKNFFSADPENVESQRAQYEILEKMINEERLLETFQSTKQKNGEFQTEPLVLDHEGFVVNGNRRITAWRKLLSDSPKSYGSFEYIDVVRLPPCEEREIVEYEEAIQVKPDIKSEYAWHCRIGMMRLRRYIDEVADEVIVNNYKLKDISELNDQIGYYELAEKYLQQTSKADEWSEVDQDEQAFKMLYEAKKKRGSKLMPHHEMALEAAAFTLISTPRQDKTGRLFTQIPDLGKSLEIIVDKVAEDKGFFDSSERDKFKTFAELVTAKTNEREEIKEKSQIIFEAIEEAKEERKGEKNASFVEDKVNEAIKCLNQAKRNFKSPKKPATILTNMDMILSLTNELRKKVLEDKK